MMGSATHPYLEGQGDLISRLITPTTHIVTLIIPVINLLTKSPSTVWPPESGGLHLPPQIGLSKGTPGESSSRRGGPLCRLGC